MSMDTVDQLQAFVLHELEELKGQDIKTIDVRNKTSITDVMVVVTGTSTRHVKAMADTLIEKAKQQKFTFLGVEGEVAADWILVDLCDLVVHIMLQETRDFYGLEKLWSVERNEAALP